MLRTDCLQGSLDLLVLKILSRRPSLHGYAIMTAIQEISSDEPTIEDLFVASIGDGDPDAA